MELLSKKLELETTFHNKLLDVETRCTAAEALTPLLGAFHKFGAEYHSNLKTLEARLNAEVTEKQAASNHDDSADRSMSFK